MICLIWKSIEQAAAPDEYPDSVLAPCQERQEAGRDLGRPHGGCNVPMYTQLHASQKVVIFSLKQKKSAYMNDAECKFGMLEQ